MATAIKSEFPEVSRFKHPLDVLDELEEIRQKASERPADYPVDYTVRLCSSIVAEYFGYEDRSKWTDRLKSDPDSNYYKRYHGVDGAVFHS